MAEKSETQRESVKLPRDLTRRITEQAGHYGTFKTVIAEAMGDLWDNSSDKNRRAALSRVTRRRQLQAA